jgi:hypothetical protein
MGTRNLTAVVVDGQFKVAQYGQWDGYPEGQGLTILNFLKNFNEALFRKRLEATRFVTNEEVHGWYIAAGSGGAQFVTSDVQDRVMEAHPYISRDHGGEILRLIAESEGPVEIQDSSDFVADSLFCEWAYVVDLDQRTLEVYEGCNHHPVPAGERFSEVTPCERDAGGSKYYPVRLKKAFNLDALPSQEEFLRETKPEEETEEEDCV